MELADVLDDAALRDLASSFGVDSRDLAILYDGRNRVYSVAAGEPRVLKVIPSWVEEPALAEAEVDWVAWLHRRGAPVVRPYPTRQGGWVARATSEGVELSACLMERLRGDPMEGRGWTPPLIEDLGAVMGRLHALTRDYVPGVGAPRRPEWYEKDWLARPEKTLHPSQAAVIERCHRLRDALMQLPRDGDAFGLIHDDLHTGNLWIRNGRITVLDFECCHTNWLASDIASALLFAIWKVPSTDADCAAEFARAFLRHLMVGYRREHHLDADWLRRLPLFLKLREMSLYVSSSYSGRDLTEERDGEPLLAFWRHNIEQDVPYVRLDGPD